MSDSTPNLTESKQNPWKVLLGKLQTLDFPGGAVIKNPPANARDMGSSRGLGRSHMPRSS